MSPLTASLRNLINVSLLEPVKEESSLIKSPFMGEEKKNPSLAVFLSMINNKMFNTISNTSDTVLFLQSQAIIQQVNYTASQK